MSHADQDQYIVNESPWCKALPDSLPEIVAVGRQRAILSILRVSSDVDNPHQEV